MYILYHLGAPTQWGVDSSSNTHVHCSGLPLEPCRLQRPAPEGTLAKGSQVCHSHPLYIDDEDNADDDIDDEDNADDDADDDGDDDDNDDDANH